jgi:hypothetical protein
MRASCHTATFFPLAASYRFCGDRGTGREQVELGSGLRHERRVQEGREPRGGEREGESCWKSGGGRVRLYTWRRGWQMRSDATPYRTRRAVKGVTGSLSRKRQSTDTPLTKLLGVTILVVELYSFFIVVIMPPSLRSTPKKTTRVI